MNVVQLQKPVIADDIVKGLRGLADRIETGEAMDVITTCVVVLGHSDSKWEGDEIAHGIHHDVYALGPRCDLFTLKGLLAHAGARL